MSKDRIYASPQSRVEDFVFDDTVADVFDDMISRSVPGYRTMISTIGMLAERFVTAGSQCYDLGCSLGAATLAMRHGIAAPNCRIIAVDNSVPMVERCRANVEQDTGETPVQVVASDLRDIAIENASMVVMNFTLQFIAPDDRAGLLRQIAAGIVDGGVLVLSEKLRFSDQRLDALHTDLHHRFKRSHGYSELEIAQKRQAIEDVLVPDTLAVHRQRLSEAGFGSVEVWFQCFNFASLIAIR